MGEKVNVYGMKGKRLWDGYGKPDKMGVHKGKNWLFYG